MFQSILPDLHIQHKQNHTAKGKTIWVHILS